MKAKISLGGILWQERQGVYREMICPFARFNETGGWSCGDWCPAFREPVKSVDPLLSAVQEGMAARGVLRCGVEDVTGGYYLQLCRQVGTLYFDEVEDQRRDA